MAEYIFGKNIPLKKVFDRGILNKGNLFRLRLAMCKARRGEQITVAFIGGSITQGCSATNDVFSYTQRVYEWFRKTFPKTRIKYLNAPAGGTDSLFGVARIDEDVLQYNPDILFLEFSVNDQCSPLYEETYEGLIRKALRCENHPAVIMLMNVMYSNGFYTRDEHLPLGLAYDLPVLSAKESIYWEMISRKLEMSRITADGLHPNDNGHALIAGLIINFLEQSMPSDIMPSPVTANRFENVVRLTNRTCRPEMDGFSEDLTSVRNSWYYFADGWEAVRAGASITFHIKARWLAVQYRKSSKHPAPVASITIDGVKLAVLDANFDQSWGDCLFLQIVSENLSDENHTVTITIDEAHDNDAASFYLASIITV